MIIKYTQKYRDNYRLLSHADKELVKDILDLFQDNPHDPSLRNHPLRKPMAGQRAISVRDDLRITFRER